VNEPMRVAEVLALVLECWPNFEITEMQHKIMHRQLDEFPQSVVVAAVDALSREQPNFFPGWGAVAKRAIELSSPPVVNATDALDEVMSEIARCGSYGTPRITNEATNVVIRALGGWRAVCMMSAEHLPHQFNSLYKPVAERVAQERALPASARAVIERASGLAGLETGERKALGMGD
jgi:hypothetical protein